MATRVIARDVAYRHRQQVADAMPPIALPLSPRPAIGRCTPIHERNRPALLATLDGPLPAGHRRWTALLIAAALGDVHEQYVWRFLRAQPIDLGGRKIVVCQPQSRVCRQGS